MCLAAQLRKRRPSVTTKFRQKKQLFTGPHLIAALMLTILSALVSGIASADGTTGKHHHIQIKNCMAQKILVCSYNGKDSKFLAEHDFKRLKVGNTAKLDCHGQGKGGCRLAASRKASGSCGLNTRSWRSRYKNKYLELYDSGGPKMSLVAVTKEEFNADTCTLDD